MKTLFLLIMLFTGAFVVNAQNRSFEVKDDRFLLDGKPFVIRSGEMHYPRVPREYWRDRMKKARAMGLNTITTYVFWNVHEKAPGKFDFGGNLDIAEYVRTAKEEGLFVIVRPGPYVCTEWDFGGIPSWLLKDRDMKVRSADPRFLKASERYMAEVGKHLAPLQITNGGNVIMVQVENEYGSFGEDKAYLQSVRKSITDAGFEVPLFTSDGSLDYMLKNGTLPDVSSVINFGAGGDVSREFANFAKFRTGVPRMVGEYWVGWFDHWGEKHHTVDPKIVSDGVGYFLSNGISFNLYMFHGGTSFGFMAGANYSRKEPYQPDISNYDYDSPLDEAGRPTPKYFAIRDVIKKNLPAGEDLPKLPAPSPFITIPAFELKEAASLTGSAGLLARPVAAATPPSMEDLGQNFGFVLYRKKIFGGGPLEIEGVRDYAHIFIDGKPAGTLDRRLSQTSVTIAANSGSTLDILVENMGRLNFGKDFIFDRKGILGTVKLNGAELRDWQVFSLPFDALKPLRFAASKTANPSFFRGKFTLKAAGDTFLDMRGWGKGHVWVNGRHLGRFWKIGPQQSLFLPGVWLKKGSNEIVVLDLENDGHRTISASPEILYGN